MLKIYLNSFIISIIISFSGSFSLCISISNATTLGYNWSEAPIIYQTPDDKIIVNHRKIIGEDQVTHDSGEKCKIAVIDSGWFDCKSGDVRQVLSKSTKKRLGHLYPIKKEKDDTDSFGHTNWVSSIIGGRNGIAPKAELEVFSVSNSWKSEKKWVDWCAKAIRKSIKSKVDFINMSIGWDDEDGNFPSEIEKALYKASAAGIGVLLAASNDSLTIGTHVYKGLGRVLQNMKGYMRIVASSGYKTKVSQDKNQNFSWRVSEYPSEFSNWLSEDCIPYCLTAPGENILSYGVNQNEAIWEGTSAATPIVTALATIIKSKAPHLNASEIFSILDESARKTKINPKSFEECVQPKLSKLLNSYNRRCRESGRHAEIIDGPESGKENREAFMRFVDDFYEDHIKLPTSRYGQGVVNIAKAFEILSSRLDD